MYTLFVEVIFARNVYNVCINPKCYYVIWFPVTNGHKVSAWLHNVNLLPSLFLLILPLREQFPENLSSQYIGLKRTTGIAHLNPKYSALNRNYLSNVGCHF